jgi:hypothetical protein
MLSYEPSAKYILRALLALGGKQDGLAKIFVPVSNTQLTQYPMNHPSIINTIYFGRRRLRMAWKAEQCNKQATILNTS